MALPVEDTVPHTEAVAVPTRTPRKAALASFLGSVVEYYDFFIYGSAAALIFPTVFFPTENSTTATLASLGTFGVGYIARPVGAVVLGHFGDRIGRKRILVMTLLMMGIATILIGCLPSYASIGVAAPLMLVILRIVQGLSASAEQSGASSMTLEHSPDSKRAYYTSFTMSGTQAGQLLATLVFIPVAMLPDEQLFTWGWRLPFLASGIVVIVALWVRRSLEETPVFAATEADHGLVKFPVVELFRHYTTDVLRVIGISLYATSGTIMTVFALNYGTETAGVARSTLLWAAAVANICQVGSIPLWAIFGDRIGRRPVLVIGLLGVAVSYFAYFTAIGTGSILYIFAASIFFGAVGSAKNAVVSAFVAEMFDARVRYSGVAISNQLGYVVAGFAPTICFALLGEGHWGWVPVAIFGSACLLVSILCTLSGKETSTTEMSKLGRTHT
ncbi:Inner membrane metabolite transport protein YhjE [Rhodococcus erythropolis]|uniref:MFS transporter n=1 Tax=Rhodococcus erythropolis TaxID=1833 RepID=UPI000BB3110B|nr:MFS transporter [Rhodococcus erythropolis]PBI88809.1 Inner membrane metabolite transport protein YhjE [Rhodococcus erythropolis]